MSTKMTAQARNQRLFNRMMVRTIRQGAPSVFDRPGESGCRYRLKRNGGMLKCPVGHVIPDAKYRPEFEMKGCKTLANMFPGFFHKDIDLDMVEAVQKVHDDIGIRSLRLLGNHTLVPFVEYFVGQALCFPVLQSRTKDGKLKWTAVMNELRERHPQLYKKFSTGVWAKKWSPG